MPAVLFVCLGNICRSPLAEGVFRSTLRQAGLEGDFMVDSAGTGAWHVGNPPDPRSIAVAAKHGVDLTAQRARQAALADFSSFDHILAMDEDNLAALHRMRPAKGGTQPRLFLSKTQSSVPDPYYGGEDGFETVYRMIKDGCNDLIKEITGRGSS